MLYKRVSLMVICLFLFSTVFVLVNARLESGDSVSTWRIVEWNEANPVIWEWGSTSFVAQNGSLVSFNTTYYDPHNFTHPSAGIISIGNLTTSTTNNKTAEVLALSIWGWFPGLLTSTNWTLQRHVAQSAASGLYTNGTLDIKDLTYTLNGRKFSAIQFDYRQSPDLGNQNTTLVYDKGTGLLLDGFTELLFAHYYVLHLRLETSGLLSTSTNSSTSSWSLFLVVSSFTILIVYRFKRVRQ